MIMNMIMHTIMDKNIILYGIWLWVLIWLWKCIQMWIFIIAYECEYHHKYCDSYVYDCDDDDGGGNDDDDDDDDFNGNEYV